MQPDNIITVFDQQYDLRQLSPTALQTLQLVQVAQAKVNEANLAAQLANLALNGSMSNLRAIMATQPVYIPPAPEPAEAQEGE